MISCVTTNNAKLSSKWETGCFLLQEEKQDDTLSASTFYITGKKIKETGAVGEITDNRLIGILESMYMDNTLLNSYHFEGFLNYQNVSENIEILYCEQKSLKIKSLRTAKCGDVSMELSDEIGTQFKFMLPGTKCNYYFSGPGHFIDRNSIFDEKGVVLARLHNKEFEISLNLSQKERNDVIRCIALAEVFMQYF